MEMKEKIVMENKLLEVGTAMATAIKQIELVLRSGQVSEMASIHLKVARDGLQEAMNND